MTRKPFRAAALSAANVQLNSNGFSTALVGSNAASANLSFTLPTSLGLSDQVITTDGSGNLFFSNVSGGSFSVALANASNALSNVITSISTIAFDTDSGFDIVDLGNNAVKVQMNSTFKFWEVEGQDTIIAEGLDTINIAAGDGIAISTNASSKTLTIAAIPEEQGDTLDDQFTVSSSNVFTLSQSVSSANNIIVSLSGIVQSPDTHYSVSGTSLIFNNSAPLTQNVHVGVRYLQVIRSSSTVTVGSGINFVDAFEISGNSNVFTLSSNVTAASDLLVLLDGVLQATTSYAIDANQLTLANVIPLSTGSLEVRGISSITSNVDAVINTSFAVDGSTNAFTLPSVPSSADGILVSIDGLVQHPDTYSVSGTTLTLANTAPLPTSKLAVRSIGSGSSGSGGVGTIDSWNTISSNTYLVSNNKYFVDSSNSAITAYLPNTASYGDYVRIIDATGNASNNTLTVARNSHKIQGASSDLIISVDRAAFGLTYFNASQGWLLTER
jgi:hypothetical protein